MVFFLDFILQHFLIFFNNDQISPSAIFEPSALFIYHRAIATCLEGVPKVAVSATHAVYINAGVEATTNPIKEAKAKISHIHFAPKHLFKINPGRVFIKLLNFRFAPPGNIVVQLINR